MNFPDIIIENKVQNISAIINVLYEENLCTICIISALPNVNG